MSYIFTQDDQKIRKRWLITLISYSLYLLCMTVLLSLDEPDGLGLIISVIPLEIVWFILLYKFTYRNNGYKLLYFTLIGSLSSIPRWMSSLQLPTEPATTGDIAALMVIFILNLAIIVWWVFISYKIVNLHRSFLPSSKCLKEMDQLQNAQNLEDLDQQLETLKGRFPKYDRSIETAYLKKRESLTAVS